MDLRLPSKIQLIHERTCRKIEALIDESVLLMRVLETQVLPQHLRFVFIRTLLLTKPKVAIASPLNIHIYRLVSSIDPLWLEDRESDRSDKTISPDSSLRKVTFFSPLSNSSRTSLNRLAHLCEDVVAANA